MSAGARRERGFTLLEVIVAATLILALVAAMSHFLIDALRIRSRVSEEIERARAADALVSTVERALETTLVEDPSFGAGVVGDATSMRILRAGLASWRLGTGDPARALEEIDVMSVRFDAAAKRIAIGRGEMAESALPGAIDEVRFRYFDGAAWVTSFDSLSAGRLPVAVEISLWLRPRRLVDDSAERPEFDEPEGSADSTEAGRPPDRLRVVTIPDSGPDGELAALAAPPAGGAP